MAIKINDIPPEGLSLELSQKLDLFDEGTVATPFSATITIKPGVEGVLHLTGSIQAETLLECSRCLNRFPYRVREPRLEVELMPAIAKPGGVERELERAELDVEFYEGEEFEPLDFIREQILLSVPMIPLHSPDCRGLCPVCGTNLNEKECGCARDMEREPGPFAGLKDLLTKKKE